jgi:hypothetical protein
VLRGAAAALAPAFWRIGGSPADDTLYEMGGFECPKPDACSGPLGKVCDISGKDHDHCQKCAKDHGLYNLPACSTNSIKDICKGEADPAGFYCLKEKRWLDILDFADAAGLSVVFGLNYADHLNLTDPLSVWNSSNARALLELTAKTEKIKARRIVYGWELGNELNIGGRAKTEDNTSRYAAAFDTLTALIEEVYTTAGAVPTAATPLPATIGPDVSWVHDTEGVWMDGILESLKRKPTAVTFHHYPAGKVDDGHGAGDEALILNSTFLATTQHNFSQIVSSVRAATGVAEQPVWWGEGAFDFHSGHEGVTNSFEDTLFCAVMYGTLSSVNIDVW